MELSIRELDKSKYYLIGLDVFSSGNQDSAANIMKAIDAHLAQNGISCVIVPFGIKQADILKEDKLMEIVDQQLKLHLYTDQVSRRDVANAILEGMK